MSALAAEHGQQHGYGWNELVQVWEQTDAPEGCKVEIIEGIVTVAPPPANKHNATAAKLQRRLYSVLPEDWAICQTQGVAVPDRSSLYIPDLAVVPTAVLETPGNYVQASDLLLAVEITSQGNANHDRVAKVRGYARASVPLYLLLDAWHSGSPTVTLYGEPKDGTYRTLATAEYGEEIYLPSPFDLALDTSVYPVH